MSAYCTMTAIEALFVYIPAAEKDVVSPHHGQGEQVVQLRRLKVVYVPEEKLPPGLPVFFTLPVTSKRFYPVG